MDNSSDKVDDNAKVSSTVTLKNIEPKSIICEDCDDNLECRVIVKKISPISVEFYFPVSNHVTMAALYPKFYKEEIEGKKSKLQLEKHFLQENWLTDELTQELNSMIPQRNDEIEDNQSFESMCKYTFPPGRQFANYRQLDQYLTLFLEKWKCVKHREGNSFRCFYAKSKKRRFIIFATPQREVQLKKSEMK